MAAQDCLRLGLFCDQSRGESFAPFRDVDEAPHEVDLVGALHEDGCYPRVVVVSLRDVAVGTLFGLRGADCVRRVRVEGVAVVACGGDCGRVVDGDAARGVCDAHRYGARRADGHHLVPLHGAVNAEHVAVGAQHLRVVRRIDLRLVALFVKLRLLRVDARGEMTAPAVRRPRRMARDA